MKSMKPVKWVFHEVSVKVKRPGYEAVPPYDAAFLAQVKAEGIYDRRVIGAICDVLEGAGVEATLRRKDRSQTNISPNELYYAPGTYLRYGIFYCDGRLSDLYEWDRAQVFLPDTEAQRAIKVAVDRLAPIFTAVKQKTGRPPHPAKAWYAEQGFQRGQRTMKCLQREMAAATGEDPPSEASIRAWEKEAQLSAETPPPKT